MQRVKGLFAEGVFEKRVLSDVVPQAGVGKWADDSGNGEGRQRQRVSECKGRRCIC